MFVKRLRRATLAVVGAVALAGSALTTVGVGTAAAAPVRVVGAADAVHTPRVDECYPAGPKDLYTPHSFVLACADAGIYLARIHWTSWGRTIAEARATYEQNDCVPNCARGHFHAYPARVTLYRPRLRHDTPTASHVVFTRLRLRFPARRPKHVLTVWPI